MKTRLTLIIVTFALLFSACSNKKALNVPAKDEDNFHLYNLLTLNIGNDTLITQDYILEPNNLDSVISKEVTVAFISDKNKVAVSITDSTPHFFNISFWKKGISYTIPCRKSDKVNYKFQFNPQGKRYKKVQIAGQMNDWAPNLSPDLVLNEEGIYEATLLLSPGTYLYQMALDGDWNHDPNNPNKVDNGYGKFNSILQIKGNADKKPRLTTAEYGKNNFTISVHNNITKVYAYWQNYLLPDDFIEVKEYQINISLPKEAKELKRSYIRVWATNEWGVSNDILIPLENGNILDKATDLKRQDQYAQIIYFALLDRFRNGNKTNDHPMNRPDVNQKVDFFGGDIAGLKEAMNDGYFEKLGVNTLWISPVNQNPDEPYGFYAPKNTKFSGYHGYWPISSSKVDYRFGSNQELKDFVADAHSKEMNILLDYVAHHVHELHPLYQEHPEYFTSLYLPDGTLNTERWNDYRLTTWFDTFMPTFDFSNPKVVDMMSDSALVWVNEFNIDGFRHDACKHVDYPFWRTLTYKMKRADNSRNLYQIGETYGSPELINSYLSSGMLNGQFDFNVFEDANTSFAGVGQPDLQRVRDVLTSSFNTYGHHNLMGYISGNHDKPRFMSLASGDLQFGEDSKAAGWNREIGITDSTAFDKMALMQTFILTIPGVPVIYYGDEIGMTGGNDPDSRRMMRFDGWTNRETKLFRQVAQLTKLRRNNLAFIYGDFIDIDTNKDSWVYARKYFNNEAIILFNNSAETKEIEVSLPTTLQKNNYSTTFGNNFSITNRKLKITLPPYNAEILK